MAFDVLLQSKLAASATSSQASQCCPRQSYQEGFAPVAVAPFRGLAQLRGMLLEEREREPVRPSEVLEEVLVPNAQLVFAVGHVQSPVREVI